MLYQKNKSLPNAGTPVDTELKATNAIYRQQNKTNRWTWADRQTDIDQPTDRQTNTEADRPTDRQSDS